MKILISLGLALLSLVSARADLTIKQTVTGGPATDKKAENMVLKVKGDRARVEVSPKITTIINAKTGEIVTMLNDQKRVMRISGEKARAMSELANSFLKEHSAAEMTPKPTGKTQTINGYQTEQYVIDVSGLHISYWVAKNYPGYQSIVQQMEVLQNGTFAALRKGMPGLRSLPGLPIRSEMNTDGHSVTTTIQSVSQDPIPDSEFVPPAEYSEIKMPDFLGGKSSPANSRGQEPGPQ